MAAKMIIRMARDPAYVASDHVQLEIGGVIQQDRVLVYGQDDVIEHETLALFVAGDYVVRNRGVDVLGNAGAWSDPVTIQHRPKPPPPTNLRLSGNDLLYDWHDP